jgi:hypothetical protein
VDLLPTRFMARLRRAESDGALLVGHEDRRVLECEEIRVPTRNRKVSRPGLEPGT